MEKSQLDAMRREPSWTSSWEVGGLDAREARWRLALSLAPGVGPATFNRLLDAFGSAEAVYATAEPELRTACPALRPEAALALRRGVDDKALRFQEESCRRLGVRIVARESSEYPDPLRQLAQPPPFLFMAGRWLPPDRMGLAVVGTRYPSGYGAKMAREFASGLAENGFTVVSGLARGIDTLAHEATLQVRGRTLAVLGAGLDWIYPPENATLAERISKSGCLISEFPMGTPPHATHFPRRNRIISGLALGTLVVEAGNDSGALITADFALDQGREVFAVPGQVHSPGANGTHRLIREGAHLVEHCEDVLAVLRGMSQAVPARRVDLPTSLVGKQFRNLSLAALRAVTGPATGAPAAGAPACEAQDGETPGGESTEMAQPGDASESVWSRGTKNRPITSPENGLESGPESSPENGPEWQGLSVDAKALYRVLGREGQTLDAITAKALGQKAWGEKDRPRLLVQLLELELRGRVKRLPGSLFRRA